MKRTLTALALATAALTAHATTSIAISDEYDDGSNYSQNEVKGTIAHTSKYGTFDAGLSGYRYRADGIRGSASGYELGYSNYITHGIYQLRGRIGYGRQNDVNIDGSGFDYDAGDYYLANVELARPLTDRIDGFVGAKHRTNAGDIPSFNKVYAGVDVALNKHYTARAAYVFTRTDGESLNGIKVELRYSF